MRAERVGPRRPIVAMSVLLVGVLIASTFASTRGGAEAANGACDCAAQEQALAKASSDLVGLRFDLIAAQRAVDTNATTITNAKDAIPRLEQELAAQEKLRDELADYQYGYRDYHVRIDEFEAATDGLVSAVTKGAELADAIGLSIAATATASSVERAQSLFVDGYPWAAFRAVDYPNVPSVPGLNWIASRFTTNPLILRAVRAYALFALSWNGVGLAYNFVLGVAANLANRSLDDYTAGKPLDLNSDGRLSDELRATKAKIVDLKREISETRQTLKDAEAARPALLKALEGAKVAVDEGVKAEEDAQKALELCRSQNCPPPDPPGCETEPCPDPPTCPAAARCPGPPISDDARSWGDPHLVTIDGLQYDFQAGGEFVAFESTTDDLLGQIRFRKPSSSAPFSFNDALVVRSGGDVVQLSSPVTVNGTPLPVPDEPLVLPGGSTLGNTDRGLTLTTPDGTAVGWSVAGFALGLSAERAGEMQGLFGDGDGNPVGDVMTRSGEVIVTPELFSDPSVDEFELLYDRLAPSWAVAPEDRLFTDAPAEPFIKPTGTVSFDSFSDEAIAAALKLCLQNGWTENGGLDSCVYDVLATGDSSFADPARRIGVRDDVTDSGNTPDLGTTSIIPVSGDGIATSPLNPADSVSFVALLEEGESLVVDASTYTGRVSMDGTRFAVCPYASSATVVLRGPSGEEVRSGICGPIAPLPATATGVWTAEVTSNVLDAIEVGAAIRSREPVALNTPITKAVGADEVHLLKAPEMPDSLVAWEPTSSTFCGIGLAITAISPLEFLSADTSTVFRVAPVAGYSAASGSSLGQCSTPGLVNGTMLAVSTMFRGAATVEFQATATEAVVQARLGEPVVVPMKLDGSWFSFNSLLASWAIGIGHPTRVQIDLNAGTRLKVARSDGSSSTVAVALHSPAGEYSNGGLFSSFGAPFGPFGLSNPGEPASIQNSGTWTLVMSGSSPSFSLLPTLVP